MTHEPEIAEDVDQFLSTFDLQPVSLLVVNVVIGATPCRNRCTEQKGWWMPFLRRLCARSRRSRALTRHLAPAGVASRNI